MAENLFAGNPFAKMFGDLNAPFCDTFKNLAAQYLANGEKWAQQTLHWNEKATAWAKSTPLASVFETQRVVAKQAVELSSGIARRLWQLEEKNEKKNEETLAGQA